MGKCTHENVMYHEGAAQVVHDILECTFYKVLVSHSYSAEKVYGLWEYMYTNTHSAPKQPVDYYRYYAYTVFSHFQTIMLLRCY